MTSIPSLIVDDEPRGIRSMQKLLELTCPQVNVIGTCSSADETLKKVSALKPELVFLDIAMPGKNGLELLTELKDFHFEVIFITAHNKFMIETFRFSAVDYLLKPVDEELLADAVLRAGKRIAEKSGQKNIEALLHNINRKHTLQNMRLCLPSLKGFQLVELADILYAEASGNYTNFHFTNQPAVCTSKPIHDYEELLKDSGFVRVHKSFLVNLLHVKEYLRGEGGMIILSNNQKLEVSRRKKDSFMEKMKSFYKY